MSAPLLTSFKLWKSSSATGSSTPLLPPCMEHHLLFPFQKPQDLKPIVHTGGVKSWRKHSLKTSVTVCPFSSDSIQDLLVISQQKMASFVPALFQVSFFWLFTTFQVFIMMEQPCWCPSFRKDWRGSYRPARKLTAVACSYGRWPCQGLDVKGLRQWLPNSVCHFFVSWRAGSHYTRRDGTCVRDYLHIIDLASGHLLALDALASESKVFDENADAFYKAYNLGRGQGVSVLQIVQAMRKATGFDYKYEIIGRRYISYQDLEQMIWWFFVG